MFSKVFRGFGIIFSKLYWNSEKKKLKECGGNSYIEYPFILIGGQYISVGKNFNSYKYLQLEAHDYHNERKYSPNISIGDNVSINYNVHIGAINQIIIEDNVLIASKVFITDHFHGEIISEDLKIPPQNRKLFSKGGVHIKRNVWIGEGVTILPGVTIGENSIIGANSVVTKDIPVNAVAVGNPCRVVKIIK